MKLAHPKAIYHFDLAGNNLSIAQAGMNRAIQKFRGFPDLQILMPKNGFAGLFIELKAAGTRLKKKDLSYASPHLEEQAQVLKMLNEAGYKAVFAVGLDEAMKEIDEYLK